MLNWIFNILCTLRQIKFACRFFIVLGTTKWSLVTLKPQDPLKIMPCAIKTVLRLVGSQFFALLKQRVIALGLSVKG